MPMSARRSAGASLTPSPVIATTWPAAQRVRDPQLGLRRRAREDDLARRSASSASSSARSSRRARGRRRCADRPPPIPTRRAISAAVSPLSPVMTMIRIPARWQRSTASATPAAADRAARPARAGSGRARRRRARSANGRPASCRRATASTRRPRREASAGSRRAPRLDPCARASRPRSRAALEQLVRRALDVHDQRRPAKSSTVVISFSRGSKWKSRDRAARRSASRHRRRGRRRLEQRDLGRIAGRAPDRVVQAAGRGARARRNRRRRSPSSSRPRRPASRPPRRIRFSVSVPVLSVQITVVAPSVSTALSRLTSAPRARQPPHADRERERDRRQQPLGHVGDEQADREDQRVAERQPGDEHPERDERDPDDDRDQRRSATPPACTSRCSGLAPASMRCDSAAIAARARSASRSRRRPPRASPPVHVVPLNTRSAASSGGAAGLASPAPRTTGTDSPVSADRSTSTAPSTSRASAQTRSPSRTRAGRPVPARAHRSPARAPSRTTRRRARAGTPRSASTACSACRSWTNANAALRTITPTIAHRAPRCPPANASAAAATQQQRERVGELREELARPRALPTADELVRTVLLEPPRGFTV